MVQTIHVVLFWWISFVSQHDTRVVPVALHGAICPLEVDAGPDIHLCLPGEVTLDGSVSSEALFTLWTPPDGLSDPSILDPTADVTGSITYTLTAWAVDPESPNVVQNGDFEQGNTAFTSDYVYVTDLPVVQDEMVPAGTYTVIHNPSLVHEAWSPCMDHTPGANDQMMLINGELALQNFWCQTVDVLPGTWYNMEAWVTSVHPSSPAVVSFSIDGDPIDPVINAPSIPCEWIPFNALWYSGIETSVEICIINLNTEAFGNDFALDDISMVALCEVSDEVDIIVEAEPAPEPVISGPALLCEEVTNTYQAILPTEPAILDYSWSLSGGGTIISGQGTPEIMVEWANPGTAEICLTIETACGENEGCYQVTINELPFAPVIEGPATACQDETIIISTAGSDPNYEYQWIVPSGLTLLDGQSTNEIAIETMTPGQHEVCLQVSNACGTMDDCIQVEVFAQAETNFDTTLCTGDVIIINGSQYGNGIVEGVEVFTSSNGCDSLVNISITEMNPVAVSISVSICPGDSIFLAGAFQSEEGIYLDTFVSSFGCDSVITTLLAVSANDTTYIFGITCDASAAGTFTETFSTGNCDSTVISVIVAAPSDTIDIERSSCNPSDTGVVVLQFQNQAGCDSIVTITTNYQLSDTTTLLSITCLQAEAGVFYDTLTNQSGCDSLVISTVTFVANDTTRLFDTSCDPGQVGVFETILIGQLGCDSVIISTITYTAADTTMLTYPVCNFQDTSNTEVLLTNILGCDSLVITQHIFTGSDTTILSAVSCLPTEAGWSYTLLSNANGCDSVIATLIALLPGDTTYLVATSCNPQDTGTTGLLLSNLLGCDSLVISTVTLEAPALCTIDAMYVVVQPTCISDTAWLDLNIIQGLGPFLLQWTLAGTQGQISFPDTGRFLIPFMDTGILAIELHSANGLAIQYTTSIIGPASWQVSLGPDTSVAYGSTVLVSPQFTGTDTTGLEVEWSDDKCSVCYNRELVITSDTSLLITVTDEFGCQASDAITIRVLVEERVVIPNVFSPNGDQLNDHFFISTNAFITEINELSIYDRWGNMVFQKFHFAPNDPSLGWNGMYKGKLMNPGVFAYKALVTFAGNKQRVYHGDVTLVR